jgi:hypothetical protein
MNLPFLSCLALCLASLLLSPPTPAQTIGDSEWIALGRTENFRVYLDQRSVQRGGDLARVYQLTDFTTAQWLDERTVVGSLKMLVEYDCARPRMRTLAMQAYSEQMAAGRLMASEQKTDAEWENITPGGSSEIVQKMVCGK